METTAYAECTGAIVQIGLDAISGDPEVCIFAIGLGQLIGKCVGRDKRTGRFVSLTRRIVVGHYIDIEPVELERRPNPRKAGAFAGRLIVGLTLMVVTATAPRTAATAMIAGRMLAASAKAARSIAGYVNREFVQQWQLALALAPCAAFLVWLVTRGS